MTRREIDKAKKLAKETLGVLHKVKHEGLAPRGPIRDMPTSEDFKKGREIAARLDARTAAEQKSKTKAKSTAKPKMTRKSYRDLLRKKK